MSETERAFILVMTYVGILASFASDTTLPEKAILVSAPLLMWFFWRNLAQQLRRAGQARHEEIE
jgi:hypothetical protein